MLTEKIAETLADEIESGRQVRWACRRAVGRPAIDQDTITPKVTFRVPTALQERLRARANRDRRTVSDLTCEALEKLLEN
jgi:hypothetical protein